MSRRSINNINRMSKLLRTTNISPFYKKDKADLISKSYKHLISHGYIKNLSSGMYALLPIGMRILNKLTTIVDNEMERIGAQKMMLPALTPSSLWKKSERLDSNKSELFRVHDRHNKQYILSPTYEETICDLVSSFGLITPNLLPLKLYQISSKWRDEMKPRLGFLRSREFIMKDLYTFDNNLQNAQKTYDAVCEAYDNIFQKIGIPYLKAHGSTGSIGGIMSHEYHFVTDIGEDTVCVCPSCQYSINKTMCKDKYCQHCNKLLSNQNVAEVGHTFLLDTKYSKPLKAFYHNETNVALPMAMGCYGLGLSRIFTVAAEIMSDNDGLRWPKCLAPYTVSIIGPKKGSKEEIGNDNTQYIEKIIEILDHLNIDTILDDRSKLTIGYRLLHNHEIGIPYTIIIGKLSMQPTPLFEIHDVNNSSRIELPLESISSYFAGIKNENLEEVKAMSSSSNV